MNVLLLCLAVLVFGATTITALTDDGSRRCVVNSSSSRRIELSSTCEACSKRKVSLDDSSQIRVMIVIAAEDPSVSPLLTVASQLLSSRIRVVIVRLIDDLIESEGIEATMRNKINSYTSCDANAPLTFKWVPVKGLNGDVSLHSSPYQALSKAEGMYRALTRMDERPDVMVCEAANVGCQITAEKLEIPSVLLSPHSMLSLVSEKTASSTSLMKLFRSRKDSFLLAKRFMQMNKIRQRFGLSLLRNPSDYFDKSTIVLINELAAPSAHRILPMHAYFVSPLLPPCIPCQRDDSNEATIIVTAPALKMADTRTLIRGIATARSDFQSFVQDTCHPDNPIHPEMCTFAKKMTEFRVLWQTQNETRLPELSPPYLIKGSKPALEILSSSYASAVATISHCDSGSYPLLALGQRLVCIPPSGGEVESPRLGKQSGGCIASLQSESIASCLVNLLIDMYDDSLSNVLDHEAEKAWYPLIDGGSLTAHIIETLAFAPRNETTKRLRERVEERTNRTRISKSGIVAILVASGAWNVLLLISLGYILRLIYVTSDPGMTNQTKRFLRSPSVQVVFQYLEELDWALLFAEKFWWCDETMIHNKVDRFLRRFEPEEEPTETKDHQPRQDQRREGSGHNVRRKRHTRKR